MNNSLTSADVRVAVVGAINVDYVVRVHTLPRPGESVLATDVVTGPGGKGANQALAARLAGASVDLFGVVGDDYSACVALGQLREARVGLTSVGVHASLPTGLAFVTVDDDGETEIVIDPGANASLQSEHVTVEEYDAVLCQLEIPADAVIAAAEACTGLFCLNVAPTQPLGIPQAALKRSDIVIANTYEHAALGRDLPDSTVVVVTDGPRDVVAYRGTSVVATCTPCDVLAVDGTGAGDAFCGALAVALASGASISRALAQGCAAGARAASHLGAQGVLSADRPRAIWDSTGEIVR